MHAKYAFETFIFFFVLKGIQIRIMWSQLNPQIRKSNKRKFTSCKTFLPVYGSILSSELVYNDYVHYCTRYAIETLNALSFCQNYKNFIRIRFELLKGSY